MKGIPVYGYGLHPRLFRPSPCINKTCKKGGNPSMVTCTSHHIPHLPGDGLVVCKSCKIWHIIALVVCGLDGWHPFVFVISQACQTSPMCIYKTYKKGGNPSMATCTSHQTPHISGNVFLVSKYCIILDHIFGGMRPG